MEEKYNDSRVTACIIIWTVKTGLNQFLVYITLFQINISNIRQENEIHTPNF